MRSGFLEGRCLAGILVTDAFVARSLQKKREEGGGRLAQQRQVVCGAVCIEGLAIFTELWNEGSCLSLGQRAVILSHPYAVIEWVVLITRLH